MLQNFITVSLLLLTYAITAGLLIWISVLLTNHFWIDPLEKANIKNHITTITAQPITAEQKVYKRIA